MPRNTNVELLENAPRPLVALGNDYPTGHVIKPHSHRRCQLLYGASGAVVIDTAHGSWMVPPQCGMWIPAGVVHEVRMLGRFMTRSIYVDTALAEGMPDRCQVVGVSPFMRSLLAEAIETPVEYDLDGRAGALMALIVHELRRLPVLPFSLPLPEAGPLADMCRRFLQAPTPHATIAHWADALGLSRRTFTRVFRAQTGFSFAAWRQRACLVSAMPRLVAGDPITQVALDLGYDNPAAFTTMFKRVLGAPPRTYLKENG